MATPVPPRARGKRWRPSVISVGVVMLCQPFWLVLYSYSFITILTGVAMFVVVTKFPD